MNERFLYRGKLTNGRGWVYGDLNMPEGIEPYILPRETSEYFSIEQLEIDEATIGQCTGLRDRKGVLIFEGDIAKIRLCNGKDYRSEIRWSGSGFEQMGAYGDQALHANAMVIIGNIHDNPELRI